ncbi:triose-phosphate isomerase [Candidatus Saccharibacteria bacterium]|nr:triose-phosphate isomerase [Candidatus Saccharibacteria bacterium]MBP9489404.1 triose-phosphate isomerase [Candidatus Saccharibacteria bacterium]MBP9552430.1 triose-phosphate isomerase [Candidatus Saccharibacteria bacterium]
MKKKVIVANWKMNLDMQESSIYLHKLSEKITAHRSMEIILAPSTFTLQSLSLQINHRQFKLAAQNFYWRDHGAYTGEVAISQLRGIVQYALVGHSERRNIFNETDKDVRAKVAAALRNNIRPILCIGETSDERNYNETDIVLNDQLLGGLANVSSEELTEVIIAYEPVWAIGTGNIALPDDVEKAVKTIRDQIKQLYGEKASKEIQVLYGGSIQPSSAADYANISGVDGLLVGGASLSLDKFSQIVEKVYETTK